MKLSNETLALLKNFNTINSNIVITKGNTIKTMSEAKNVVAEAQVTEEFTDEIGIYYLGEFLSVYSMFNDPEIEHKGTYLQLKEGKNSVKYYLTDPSILTTPQKSIKMPKADVVFVLSKEDLQSIRKASSALGAPDLVIKSSENNSLLAVVTDISNKTSNTFEIELSGKHDSTESFELVYSISNLKLVDGDYNVEISKKLISKFTKPDLTYYIALEKTSKFGG